MAIDNHATVLVKRHDRLYIQRFHKTALGAFQDVDVLSSGQSNGQHPVLQSLETAGNTLEDTEPYGMVAIDFDQPWIGSINGYTSFELMMPVLFDLDRLPAIEAIDLPSMYREHPDIWSQISALDFVRIHRIVQAFKAGAITTLYYADETFLLADHGLDTIDKALALYDKKRRVDLERGGPILIQAGFGFAPKGWLIEDLNCRAQSKDWELFIGRLEQHGMLPSNHTSESLLALAREN